MQIKLRLNGKERHVDVEGEMPILWVLRDVLKLTGTKFGCGKGLCGACTVHLNGQPIRSCITPVVAAQGQEIITIEGVGTPEHLHPVQQAWVTHNVPQCGYCQCGQIMTAVAFLRDKPKPTVDEIKTAMAGNICRCGTYPRIVRAMMDAASRHRGGANE